MRNRLGLAEMTLNQFTLPARMANKVACWGRSNRTLKPKGRLSHAWNRRFKGNTHTRERELLRGAEQSQILSLAPQHYLLLLFISHHYVTAYYRRSCKTCLAVRDQVVQDGKYLIAPYHRTKITDIFVQSNTLFGFIFLASRFSLHYRMSMTFISDLHFVSTCHILAWVRKYELGGNLFQNVWEVALELKETCSS